MFYLLFFEVLSAETLNSLTAVDTTINKLTVVREKLHQWKRVRVAESWGGGGVYGYKVGGVQLSKKWHT